MLSRLRNLGRLTAPFRRITPTLWEQQKLSASSHSENTNTFILQVWCSWGIECRTLFVTIGVVVKTDEAVKNLFGLGQALQELEYPDKLQQMLLTPGREMTVELTVHLDNGEVGLFNAFRVQHDNSRGPYKGGLRFHPQVDLDDVRRWDIAFLQNGKLLSSDSTLVYTLDNLVYSMCPLLVLNPANSRVCACLPYKNKYLLVQWALAAACEDKQFSKGTE